MFINMKNTMNAMNALDIFKQQQKKIQKQQKEEKKPSISIGMQEEDSEERQKRIQERLKSIRMKMAMGKKLTASDLEFLRQNDAMLYLKAIKLEMSRKMLKEQIKRSKTKEEVHKVVSSHMSSACGTNEDKQMEQAAVADESADAMKSDRYKKLPATERERKKKENMKKTRIKRVVLRAKFNTLLANSGQSVI
ncbi:hypothetical protein [Anaerosporobacter sp.]|uniref:hypothetical protein n=1 Tax=Anaerosporobacter sp. TaxID=1872529 RepID=UPI00286FA834|nr:hypothetical protein [Anaerosporobacter sp.]